MFNVSYLTKIDQLQKKDSNTFERIKHKITVILMDAKTFFNQEK